MESEHGRATTNSEFALRLYGVNHTIAPIEVREQLRRIHAERSAGSPALIDALNRRGVKEYTVLATCNRVEIYTVGGTTDGLPELITSFHENTLSPDDESIEFYEHSDRDAVRHLARVACGLDSMILGEAQIQGQVAESLAEAHKTETIGPVLTEVFQTALRCGKRARTETCIGCNPSSISAAAVYVAQQLLGDLSKRRFLLVGAGEMGGLALKAFSYRGVQSIDVISRTMDRARETANPWGATAHTFDDLGSLLLEVDAVFTATGSETPVISRALLQETMQRRDGRELLVMDIAVPRDVEPDATDIPGVQLLDIDSLEETVHEGLAERRAEVPLVETIIDEELADFPRRVRERMVRPVIADIRRQAEMARREEMARLREDHTDWSDLTLKEIDRFTRSLVHRLFSPPMNHLRNAGDVENVNTTIHAARRLFSLDETDR